MPPWPSCNGRTRNALSISMSIMYQLFCTVINDRFNDHRLINIRFTPLVVMKHTFVYYRLIDSSSENMSFVSVPCH